MAEEGRKRERHKGVFSAERLRTQLDSPGPQGPASPYHTPRDAPHIIPISQAGAMRTGDVTDVLLAFLPPALARLSRGLLCRERRERGARERVRQSLATLYLHRSYSRERSCAEPW